MLIKRERIEPPSMSPLPPTWDGLMVHDASTHFNAYLSSR